MDNGLSSIVLLMPMYVAIVAIHIKAVASVLKDSASSR